MVGPNGLEPSTSSVSRKRSNQTELRAYIVNGSDFNSTGSGQFRQRLALGPKYAESRADHGLEIFGDSL